MAQAEEDIAALAVGCCLAPDLAVAEVSDGRDRVVERRLGLARRLDRAAVAFAAADLDVAEGQVVAVEKLGHFFGGGQRFAFRAAVVDRLRAQGLDAGLQALERRGGFSG